LDLFDLSGRVAIVTGGSKGIGFAIEEGLASSGALVVIAATNSDGTEAAAAKIRAEGSQAKSIAVDVTKRDSVQEMVAQTMEDFGPFRWVDREMSPRRLGPSCFPLRKPVALLGVHDHRRFRFPITAT